MGDRQIPGKGNRLFILFACLVFAVIFCVENINQRFWLNDFEVYFLAAKAFVSGTQVYGVPFGEDTGLYKYSPVLLLPFSVFTLLSYYPASVVQFLIICVSTVFAGLLMKRITTGFGLHGQKPIHTWVLPISIILVLNHLFRELHLGNLNMIIVFLLCYAMFLILKDKQWLSGMFIGACLLMKPYLIVLVVSLLGFRKYKSVISAGIFSLVCIGLMAIIAGWSRTVDLHKEWFAAMTAHGTYLFSNHTLAGILRYYTGWDPDGFSQYLFPALFMVVFIMFLLSRRKQPQRAGEMILFFFSVLALVPNLFITDTEHFLFSFPLIVLALYYLFQNTNKVFLSLFIMFVILYGANSSDFFGHDLSDRFEVMGFLGIGNLGLIVLTNYGYWKSDVFQKNTASTNLVL